MAGLFNTGKKPKPKPDRYALQSDPYYATFEKKELGKGGCGSVYMYYSFNANEERVAVKEILKSGKDAQLDYTSEMEAFRTVGDHKYIVKFLCTWADQACWYIAMELCAGSLENIRTRLPKYTEDTVKTVVEQLSEALDFLHQKNVCHRDIKPDNVLVRRWSPIEVALTDFNFSKKQSGKIQTTLQTTLGTTGYKAPEVEWPEFRKKWKDEKGNIKATYNHKCDIFSLGVLMYKLLSGFRANPYEVDMETVEQLYDDAADDKDFKKKLEAERKRIAVDKELKLSPAPHWNEKVSEEAKEILRRMLEPDYKKRCGYGDILGSAWVKSTFEATEPLFDANLYATNQERLRRSWNYK